MFCSVDETKIKLVLSNLENHASYMYNNLIQAVEDKTVQKVKYLPLAIK